MIHCCTPILLDSVEWLCTQLTWQAHRVLLSSFISAASCTHAFTVAPVFQMPVTFDSLAIFIKYLRGGLLIWDWSCVVLSLGSIVELKNVFRCDQSSTHSLICHLWLPPLRLSSWWEEAICPQTSVSSTRTALKPWKGWWPTASRSLRMRGRSSRRWTTHLLIVDFKVIEECFL